MQYENNFYRTSDGLLDVEFLFVDLGGSSGWRAYILTDINYKMFSRIRSTDCSIIHRLTEGNNDMKRKIINVSSKKRIEKAAKNCYNENNYKLKGTERRFFQWKNK